MVDDHRIGKDFATKQPQGEKFGKDFAKTDGVGNGTGGTNNLSRWVIVGTIRRLRLLDVRVGDLVA
jgi:hypothetical protein